MHLLVKPDSSKFWVFRFRFEGKENSLSMGCYPDVSLAQAEAKVRDAHKKIAEGINPSDTRKAEKTSKHGKAANSFEVIAREWITSYMVNKSVGHQEKVLRRFELYLFPWIGDKVIADITAPEVLAAIKRIEKLGILETAHRTLQTAGQVFRYAVQHGYAIRDVTAALKGVLPAISTKPMAAFTEPKDVAELLRALEAFKGTLTVYCAPQSCTVGLCAP